MRSTVFRAFFIGVAAVLMGTVWASNAYARLGFEVSPSRFRIQAKAGEAVSEKILVRNFGSYPVRVATEVTDMANLKGEDDLLYRDEVPASTTPHSCARWIQILGGEGVVIPAESEGTVEFVVTPPPEATEGGFAAYLFVTGAPSELPGGEDSDKPRVGFVTIPRMGISVMYEIEGTVQRTGEMVSFDFIPPSETDPMKLRYEFANTGNAEVVLDGSFHVLDEEGLLAGKGALKTLKSFPGEQGFGETAWDHPLEPGKYTLLATFEMGPDATDAIVRELEFEISSQ